MKRLNRILVCLLACVLSSQLVFAETANNFAIQISDLLDTVNQKDLWAVREWLRTKRVALNNKLGDFTISGDVKAEWRNTHQKFGADRVIGSDLTNIVDPLPNNMYTVDFRLYFDYKADKTWASIKLDFDEAAGLFGGQTNNLALARANMGYHLFDNGNMRLDVLVGRQRGYELYSSQVQFNSTYDGFTGLFAAAVDGLADFSLTGGGYIFNANWNHPFWIVQAGIYDFLDSGFYAEYSFVNWKKNTSSVTVQNNVISETVRLGPEAWAFRNNQFILGYAFNPEVFGRDVRLFGGILWNVLAKAKALEDLTDRNVRGKQNLAGWIALQIGSVQCAGDWAAQVQWQVVQPYAIPDWDIAGMSSGNGVASTLFGISPFTKAPDFTGRGSANFNGFEFDALYSVSNELVLEARLQRALATTRMVPTPEDWRTNYTNITVSAIYGF